MAYSNRSQLEMLAGRVKPALHHGKKAIALAETLGRSDIVCHSMINIGTAEKWMDAERGRQLLDCSLKIALDQNLQDHAARAYTNRAWAEMNLLAFHAANRSSDLGSPTASSMISISCATTCAAGLPSFSCARAAG